MAWMNLPFLKSAAERKLARARKHLAVSFFTDALYDLEGLEGEEAAALRAQATAGMVQVNLQEWQARTSSGERDEARDALDRARRYGATEQDISLFRQTMTLDGWSKSSTVRTRPRP